MIKNDVNKRINKLKFMFTDQINPITVVPRAIKSATVSTKNKSLIPNWMMILFGVMSLASITIA